MVTLKFERFFLHHGFPSLYNIVFMVCLITWACSSVITKCFEANCYAFWRNSFDMDWLKSNNSKQMLCGFSSCQCCWTSRLYLLYFSTSWYLSLIWYNLLADFWAQARVYESAAWFIFKIWLVFFEGNKCCFLCCNINSVTEFKSLCNAFVLLCVLQLYGFW